MQRGAPDVLCLSADSGGSLSNRLGSESTSKRLFMFVVCFEKGEEGKVEFVPAVVTTNQDEANAHLESHDPIYSVPMPEKICGVGGALRRRELRAGGQQKRRRR